MHILSNLYSSVAALAQVLIFDWVMPCKQVVAVEVEEAVEAAVTMVEAAVTMVAVAATEVAAAATMVAAAMG